MSIADKCRSILNENMLNKLDFYRNLYKRRLYLVQNTYEKQALEAARCLFEE